MTNARTGRLVALLLILAGAVREAPVRVAAAAARPPVPTTYDGREPDAPWRKAAARRIETIRKGSLTVAVVDAAGKPVADAEVKVAMKRHAFGFGSAIDARTLIADTDDGRRYRQTIATCFSKVVFENDLKWPQWEDKQRRGMMLKALGWLDKQGIAARGHCLVWPSWRRMPKDVEGLKNDKAALRRRIDSHVQEEVSALKGRITDWDVINEPLWNHDAMDVCGKEVMAEWYKTAHRADPATVLYLNDQNILAGGGTDRKHQDHYEGTVRYLRKEGAPLGGLGMQCHFGGNLTPPARLVAILDRFAAFGLPIQVTEFDINTKDRGVQADYMRDFLTTLFSHPKVKGILMWGFWAGRHWKPDAALFSRDWTLRPHGNVWKDLVLKTWWTDATGRTDARGRFTTRGFLGDYEVTAAARGKTQTVRVSLTKPGTTVTVRIGQ